MSAGTCGCAPPLGGGLSAAELNRALRAMEADRHEILRAAGLGEHGGAPGRSARVNGGSTEPWRAEEPDILMPRPDEDTDADADAADCAMYETCDEFETLMMMVMEYSKVPSGAFALMSPCSFTATPGAGRDFHAPRLVYAGGFTNLPAFAARGFPDESPIASAEFPYASPTSLFRVASISKIVTALGVMRAVEKELLNLEDRASDLVDFMPSGMVSDLITIRHLLSHYAGLPHETPNDRTIAAAIGGDRHLPISSDIRIAYMASRGERVDVPEASNHSSNYGYTVLERIIEEATGVSYTSWIRSQVLRRMGMDRTTTISTLSRASAEVCYYDNQVGCDCDCDADCSGYYSARSVMSPDRDCVRSPYGHIHYEARMGPAGWVTSVKDLMRMVRYFVTAWHGSYAGFLSAANAAEMVTPQFPSAPSSVVQGLGWFLGGTSSSTSFGHSGRLCGTTSALRCLGIGNRSSDNGASLVYVFNTDASRSDRADIANELEDLVLGRSGIGAFLGAAAVDFSAITGDLASTC